MLRRSVQRRKKSQTRTTEALELRCLLSSITVTSVADTVADDGEVTLREALIAANEDRSVDGSTAGNGADEIVFAQDIGSTITLANGQLEITSDIAIRGPSGRMTIDAQSNSRILEVSGTENALTLENLELINGHSDWGSAVLIYKEAADSGTDLRIINSVLRDNLAEKRGGAVLIQGHNSRDIAPELSTLEIRDSVFENNTALRGQGGAVRAFGRIAVDVEGSDFVGNYGRQDGGGLSVYDPRLRGDTDLLIESSTFQENTSLQGHGGGIYFFANGSATIDDVEFIGNSAGNTGGGLRASIWDSRQNQFVVRNTLIADNVAKEDGGGLYGAPEIDNVEIRGNHAGARGGGVFTSLIDMDNVIIADNSAVDVGGGIYVFNNGGSLTNSEVTGNTSEGSGGGIYSRGPTVGHLFVADTLIAHNTATGTGSVGGGIAVEEGNFALRRVSVIGNSTTGRNGGGGGIHSTSTNWRDDRSWILNSTFSGNTTTGSDSNGGAINVVLEGRNDINGLYVENSTFVGNSTQGSSSRGGGVYARRVNYRDTEYELRVVSSVFSENQSTDGGTDLDIDDGFDSVVIANSFISDNTSTDLEETGDQTPDSNGNFVGSSTAPIDPMLQPLAVFGEDQLPIYVARDGSPLIDNGSNDRSFDHDNRGHDRVSGPAADIGATEGIASAFLTLSAPTVTEGDSGQTTANFVVTVHGDLSSDVIVAYETFDGIATLEDSDYEAASGSITIAGDDGTTANISVTVNGDTAVERTETFGLRITEATAVGELGTTYDALQGLPGTIEPDDAGVRHDNRELTIRGTEAADTLSITDDGDDYLVTLNGSDTRIAKSELDIVFAKTLGGDDSVDFTALMVPSRIVGDEGNDTLIGGSGDDLITGSGGEDSIVGGHGNDTLRGGGDADYIDGQAGDDEVNGGSADDTLLGGSGHDTLSGLAGLDLIDGQGGSDDITGGADADSLIGGGGRDTIFGEGGADSIFGGAGDDSLQGGSEDDTLAGSSGNDVLNGDEGEDELVGGTGWDQLSGNAGNDLLDGGPDSDVLYGGSGNDKILGRAGNDRGYGGAGNDTLLGSNGIDYLFGNDGEDVLNGQEDADRLVGGPGNDTLNGAGGSDVLLGGKGNDRIEGADGNDIMVGDEGLDTLLGGAGDDLLIAGTDKFDSDAFDYTRLWNEWTSERSYEQRVKNIRGSSGKSDDRSNGTAYFRGVGHNNPTTYDDGDAGDILRGNEGMDFFFAHKRGEDLDRVYREAGEILNQL